jgi:Uma2 family endonuclease
MLREAPVKTATTFAEFLEFEQQSQERHEFVDGNLFVMAGGTTKHNVYALILISMMMQHALQRGYIICNDVILETPFGRGYYPDAYVVPLTNDLNARVQQHPVIIIEVLSDSTEAIDRGEKWQAYQQILSLEQYVLLSQNEVTAEVFTRDGRDWRYKKLEADEKLVFSKLEFEIVLSSLYGQLPALESTH